jgi:peptide/nickel transport system substrate-binding protein
MRSSVVSGVATTVSTYDQTQLTDVIASGEYDMFVWGWTPFVDPDPMLSYFTCAQVTTDPASAGYNDANWCSEEYDKLYEQQNQELDRDKRIEIVHQMLTLFHNESTYVVLYHDADTQAYRTDRFTGWVQQPKDTGPVLFSNTSPSYWSLAPIGEAGSTDTTAPGSTDGSGTETTATGGSSGGGDDGGSNTGVIIAVVVAAIVALGIGIFTARVRGGRDDRE